MSTSYDSEIQVVGAVADEYVISQSVIERLMASDRIEMSHGDEFTGKPGTKIYASDTHILKLKTEIRLDKDVALKWVGETLRKEKALGVYHPSKTWLLLNVDDEWYPANITQRLLPLHVYYKTTDVGRAEGWECERLLQLFEFYLKFSRRTDERLDEGLSNFALDAHERLYYIDDDIYRWDEFYLFSQALGIYFRHLAFIKDRQQLVRLASGLKLLLEEIYPGEPIWPSVISEQLKHQFFPKEIKENVALFTAELSPEVVHHYRTSNKQRYLVIMADIHANEWAFESVLSTLKKEGISQGIIAGDIVGYGPSPNECVALAAESGFVTIQGNHDYALARGVVGKGFSASAQWSFDWSMSVISDESRRWLASLPPLLEDDGYMVVHGAPIDPSFINAYVYQMTFESNLKWMQHQGMALCFHGHTHIQGAYVRDARANDSHVTEPKLELMAGNTALVCPGSVGQPRDGGSGARYAIYDLKRKRITFHEEKYDLSDLHQAMKQEQFPEKITRLFPGQK